MNWPTAACNSCSAVIIWATTEAGKKMPVDLEPAKGGNVEVIGSRHHPVAKVYPRTAIPDSPSLRWSHFATCPRADRHRRPIDDTRKARQRTAEPRPDLFGEAP